MNVLSRFAVSVCMVLAGVCLVQASAWAAPPPSVTDVSPAFGPVAGGTVVTIKGANFTGATAVTFDTPATQFNVDSDTQITATTAAHALGPVTVTVTVGGRTASWSQQFMYQGSVPTFTSLTPNTGSTAGGYTVTIAGTGFATGAAVTFGGTAGSYVSVAADGNSLTVTVPAHTPAGAVDVIVTNIDNQSVTGTGANGFTYTEGGGGGGGGGTFRWLTTPISLPGTTNTDPKASTNLVYDATLLTANAQGPVTFTIAAGRLPAGLLLDKFTGFITGRPTTVEEVAVTFDAFDGTTHLQLAASIKVSATGGGGNAGVSFPLPTQQADGSLSALLPQGRVGQAYSQTITIENGVGPFYFGALDLPPGIKMGGIEDHDKTFTLAGTPAAAGTFYVALSATDVGEGNNKIVVVTPLVILPAGSDFQFTTKILDNGEVGTAYSDTVTTDPAGGVKFGASGLPPGLSMAEDGTITQIPPATGPTAAGTFMAIVSASNGTDTITMNRPVVIVPSATSTLHWIFSGGLPTATMNIPYDRTNPPLALAADPAATYSASGLPEGISYDPGSGALSGTATEPGIFPVVFTATVSGGEVVTFSYDFVVLPPDGGDVNSLPINLWVKKGQLKLGTDGKESWQMQYIFNANRTKDRIFTPQDDPFVDVLGSIPELNITPPTNKFEGNKPKYSWKSAKGKVPARAVKLDMSGQTIAVTGKSEVIPDTVPSVTTQRMTLGHKGYKLDLFFDSKGKFTPALGYRKTAFVVATAKASTKGGAKDSATFGMFMGDPGFKFPAASGSKTVRIRVMNSSNQEVINKDFTAIVTATTGVDKATGATVYKLKSGKDTSKMPGKFSYDSKSGKMQASVKGLTLTGLLAGGESHVSVELTIGDTQYYTGVTLFSKNGSYSTKMP